MLDWSRRQKHVGNRSNKIYRKNCCCSAECQMDIGFVIDSSNNIGRRRFNLQKNFVIKLVATLKVGQTGPHIGLIQTGLDCSAHTHTHTGLLNPTPEWKIWFSFYGLKVVLMNSISHIPRSDSPRTEFFLTNYTQPKELLFAIKELAFLGGESNTGITDTHTHTGFALPL